MSMDEPPGALLSPSLQAPEPGAGRGEGWAEPPHWGLWGRGRHCRAHAGRVHLQILAGKSQALQGGGSGLPLTPSSLAAQLPRAPMRSFPGCLFMEHQRAEPSLGSCTAYPTSCLPAVRYNTCMGNSQKYDILEEQGQLGKAGCRISSLAHTHACTERGRKENVLCFLIYTVL